MKLLRFAPQINTRALKICSSAFICLLVTGCSENDLQKVKEISLQQEKVPQETGKTIEVIYTDSARLKARVFAPSMQKFQNNDNNYIEMNKGVKAYFYNQKGEKNSELRANYGIRYLDKNKTVVKEDVVVVNKKGDTLETEKLIWNQRKNKIFSDQFVKVKTSEEIIYAKGFESNPSFTEYKFYNIKGTIQVDEED